MTSPPHRISSLPPKLREMIYRNHIIKCVSLKRKINEEIDHKINGSLTGMRVIPPLKMVLRDKYQLCPFCHNRDCQMMESQAFELHKPTQNPPYYKRPDKYPEDNFHNAIDYLLSSSNVFIVYGLISPRLLPFAFR